MGGPSAEATANQAAQAAFYNQVTAQQATAFSEQQDILSQIQAVSMPILQAGPNQYGFTPEEDALLRGEITTNAAQAETNAVNASEMHIQQEAGGAPVLPTGAQAETEAETRLLGEQNKAEQLSGERLAGYQAGQQRYAQALGALTGNASFLNPTSYTNAASGAGQASTSATKLMDSERSNLLSSIMGGVIGAGTSFLTGGLSNITGGGSFFSPTPTPPPTTAPSDAGLVL